MLSEEKAFLRAAVAALPRLTDIISGYTAEVRAGAFEVAERRFIECAVDYGCTEIAARIAAMIACEWPRSTLPHVTSFRSVNLMLVALAHITIVLAAGAAGFYLMHVFAR
jgi:hypothetical protein